MGSGFGEERRVIVDLTEEELGALLAALLTARELGFVPEHAAAEVASARFKIVAALLEVERR